MKVSLSFVMLFVMLTGLAFAAGQAEASKPSAGADADKAAIAQVWVDYSKYAMEGNLNAFLDLHERNAYRMPQDQPMFQPWAIKTEMQAPWAKRVQDTPRWK